MAIIESFFQFITDGDMSSTITSDPLKAVWVNGIYIQLKWTGTPSGTIVFYNGINDNKYLTSANIYEKLKIVTVASGLVTQVETVAGTQVIGANFQSASVSLDSFSNANWYKVIWTQTSGSGTMQGYYLTKSKG